MTPGLSGVYSILSTPFREDGQVDLAAVPGLVERTIAAGVTGITALGVAGEAQKLSDAERQDLLAAVLAATAGRVPVVAGVSRDATVPAVEATDLAMRMGCVGAMVAPPTFAHPGPGLTRHFAAIAEVGLPIILQDFPPANGVFLSPAAMAELVHAIPAITTVKLEDPPTPQRVAQTAELVEGRATVLGGIGGLYLLEELRAGTSGTMTGFAVPEFLVAVVEAWQSGDFGRATRITHEWLPLVQLEGQPKLGVAIRKELLRRRGWMPSATVRQPGPSLDPSTVAAIDATVAAMGIDLAAIGREQFGAY